jgi:hypothetical protein
MMAYKFPGVVDETSTVPSEQPARRVGVDVAPRVDSVLAGHVFS